MWDVEGHRFIDLVQSYGAVIAGPRPPEDRARRSAAAAGDGTSYGAPTEREVQLAEEIRRRVPCCDKVRMVSSGTEATMTALRLARGLHRPHPGREVRRQLPRARRRPAGGERQRRGPHRSRPTPAACPARPAYRPPRSPTRPSCRTTCAGARRHRGLRDRGAGGREHGSGRTGRRVPRRPPCRVRPRRRAARSSTR